MKEVTPEIRQHVRIKILQILKASGELGQSHLGVHTGLAAAGITDWTPADVRQELKLMSADMQLVAQETNKFLGELARWRITESGREALAEIGL